MLGLLYINYLYYCSFILPVLFIYITYSIIHLHCLYHYSFTLLALLFIYISYNTIYLYYLHYNSFTLPVLIFIYIACTIIHLYYLYYYSFTFPTILFIYTTCAIIHLYFLHYYLFSIFSIYCMIRWMTNFKKFVLCCIFSVNMQRNLLPIKNVKVVVKLEVSCSSLLIPCIHICMIPLTVLIFGMKSRFFFLSTSSPTLSYFEILTVLPNITIINSHFDLVLAFLSIIIY